MIALFRIGDRQVSVRRFILFRLEHECFASVPFTLIRSDGFTMRRSPIRIPAAF